SINRSSSLSVMLTANLITSTLRRPRYDSFNQSRGNFRRPGLRHRERWRSTNLLERSLGEVRRRTKVMGRFPGETSCLSLVWAVLDLFISHASNGATFTDVDRQHLYRIKYQQADPDTIDEEVTAA
ncbi:MAG: transposase, partial [Solirubrobacteraceae bacterium]